MFQTTHVFAIEVCGLYPLQRRHGAGSPVSMLVQVLFHILKTIAFKYIVTCSTSTPLVHYEATNPQESFAITFLEETH